MRALHHFVTYLLLIVPCVFTSRVSDLKTTLRLLYEQLEDPHVPPSTSTGSPVQMNLSTRIENIHVGFINGGLVCRATITLQLEWPTSQRVTEFAKQMDGAILDQSKTWTPKLLFRNVKTVEILGRSLEIRNGKIEGKLVYKMSVYVEALCIPPEVQYPFSRVLCPIMIQQVGYWKLLPFIKLADSEACVLRKIVRDKTLGLDISVSKMYDKDQFDPESTDYTFVINVCWHQAKTGAVILRIYLPCLICSLLSILSLWCSQRKSRIILNVLLLLIICMLWSFSPDMGIINAIDIWMLFTLGHTGLCLILPLFSTLSGKKNFNASIQRLQGSDTCSPRLHQNKNTCLIPLQEFFSDLNSSVDFMPTPPVDIRGKRGAGNHGGLRGATVASLGTRSRCDRIAKALLPLAYCVFALVYWVTLLTTTEKCDLRSTCRAS